MTSINTSLQKSHGSRAWSWLKRLLVCLALLAVTTTIVVKTSGDPNAEQLRPNVLINDVTRQHPTWVQRVVEPRSIDDMVDVLRGTDAPISIGGGRFSQGGQIATAGSIHLDMRRFNRVLAIDKANKTVTVEPGITWRDLQEQLDKQNLSVKIMQTYANFTVGGSLSVNVHGRYIGEGPLVRSVQSIKLALADGSVVTASPKENSDIFFGAIGGYGGLGVIVEATLQVADNDRIERQTHMLAVTEYKQYFFDHIRSNSDVVFHNADIYPPKFEKAHDVSWYKTDKPLTDEIRLTPKNADYGWQPAVADFVADYAFAKQLRETVMEPVYYSFPRIVQRNREASFDVAELEPTDRSRATYALREYFVPVERFDDFVSKMRDIFQRHNANIINVSIRHALADPGTLLAWARTEVFAFVVYYRQGTDAEAVDAVKAWSQEMVDAAIACDGTYYLPYHIYATREQFEKAYPDSPRFFALKRTLDPHNRFVNPLWGAYDSTNASLLANEKQNIKHYYRGEEQTFLTIPEWYLVFNPVEYADFLDAGNNPSDFPFFASIDEYWRLYDRVRAITARDYPANDQYLTMLQVIGVSTTVEYMIKAAYENTLGRLSRWIAQDSDTQEEKIMRNAYRAYSEMIYDKAWYEFGFAPWIATIWRDTDFVGPNFIRKLERKLFFTAEFGIKALYAKAIGIAAQSAYEPSEGLIYVTATSAGSPPMLPDDIKLIAQQQNAYLLAVPRWGRFTTAMPELAKAGLKFDDISGNKEIAVSVIVNKQSADLPNSALTLFTSRVVSDSNLQRKILLLPVRDIDTLIAHVNDGMRIEHFYDF